MKTETSHHFFEFCQWIDAFKKYHELEGTENLRMVISTHWATQGYWIETSTEEVSFHDYQYVGKEVIALEKRVTDAIKQQDKDGLPPGLIL